MKKLRLLTLFLCLMPLSSAFAQSEPAVVSGDKAYFFGKPEVIVPADASNITFSPDKRYVLFAQNALIEEKFQRLLPPVGPPAVDGVALYLYDTRRGRSSVLWKVNTALPMYHSISDIAFLPDGLTAIVTLVRAKPLPDAPQDDNKEVPLSYETMLLLINITRGTSRVVSYQEKQTDVPLGRIFPAPQANEAMLVYDSPQDHSYHMRLVSASGLGEPLSVDGNFVYWAKWNKDGSEFAGRAGFYNAQTRERTSKWFILDRKTRAIRYQLDQPKWFTLEDAEEVPPTSAAPIRLTGARGTASTGTLKRDVPCVIAESTTTPDRYLVATDAEPISLVGDAAHRAILYRSNATIYAAPIYTFSYTEYATYMRKSIEANAKQIESAMEQWMFDNKATTFPKSPDAISLLVGKTLYIKRDDGFYDPRTGAIAFQNIFTGSPDATGNVPRFVLQTSFGKLTQYVDGKPSSVWDPPAPPTTP